MAQEISSWRLLWARVAFSGSSTLSLAYPYTHLDICCWPRVLGWLNPWSAQARVLRYPRLWHQHRTPAQQGVSGVCSHRALILVQQFILCFFSSSRNCWDFGSACCADARSACTSARRFVLARHWRAAVETRETRLPLLAALPALTTLCWWEQLREPAVFC